LGRGEASAGTYAENRFRFAQEGASTKRRLVEAATVLLPQTGGKKGAWPATCRVYAMMQSSHCFSPSAAETTLGTQAMLALRYANMNAAP
jgi:hypothetical protein